AIDRRRGIGNGVVVVAANNALLADGQLKDVVRRGLVTLDHGEDTQRLPLLVVGRLGLTAGVGNIGGLLGVVRLGRCYLVAVVDVAILVGHGIAVVVVSGGRVRGIADVTGAGVPNGGSPGGARGPAGGGPGARIAAVPPRPECVVIAKAATNVPSLV